MNDDLIRKLIEKNPNSISITYNDNHSCYRNAREEIELLEELGCLDEENCPLDVRAKCAELDQLWEVRVYPTSPVGFVNFYHWDLTAALQKMCEAYAVVSKKDQTSEETK